MRILIVYATNSSGTQAVSEIVGGVLRDAGHAVTTKRAYESGAKTFSGHDLIILGSCTWERLEGETMLDGQLQQHMYDLVEKMSTQSFPGKRFALYGLGDSSYTHFCAAADHLEEFVKKLQGKLIVPSLRIDGFFFDLNENRKRAHRWAETLAAHVRP